MNRKGAPARVEGTAELDSFVAKLNVQGPRDEAVTLWSQLLLVVDFLNHAYLFEPFVEQVPLSYISSNAPQLGDLLGALVQDVLAGANRYAHVNALRHDSVGSRRGALAVARGSSS